MSFAYLASTPGLNHNHSLLAVPAGWVVSMAPLWWAVGKANSVAPGTYKNANPKESWENLDSADISATLKRQLRRAVDANNNNHTNLPLFAAGLAAANAAHVDSGSLHLYSAGFLLSRIGYNLAYVLIEEEKYSWARTILYWSGVYASLGLFVKAAVQYRKLPW
ncbi:hypothetical protein I317_06411 [Kwoniella heveanensis CBS 569]|uniref:Uncharacterized protein n=1 Tax=Kwoniella heveanensis BCC8398 TaxID=1296120 RepID=A0A1B9GI09_9TREE|nr:hypothetical protein I316_07653 [Kwoniella heveanensis BCC8398]OCF39802.1 hypothetical protein I317_06411 [Kwoniella heveanensis CBS 569]